MGGTVWAGLALFAGLGGLVACLAGRAGLREIRRLRRVGLPAQALVRYRMLGEEDRAGSPRPLLQFTTVDGRVAEVFSPVPSSRSRRLVDGGQVWITYDPADPGQVLVDGRERRWLEYAFLASGSAITLTALTLLTYGT
ncbi:DUF3592 domain-containing protein [Saccharothrix sp. ST-888]|uniref:DUF3592 domain-containing protein n=1 Tax=Saccharothrix sp. ST-888 TaxID=1427391 RepID=UPI0005EC5ED1|nr:DUF3592 domain-containing protein [Saccharothrix sp. ST-888]KJK59281.1 hypothetical protein UK12_05530 [Saccharothrix sp. ST-888]